jgi:putative ABC transport system permease protein
VSANFIDPSSKQGVVQIGLGLMLGLGLALAITAVGGSGIQNTLFGINPRDPLTYAVVVTLVTTVSLIATLVPAQRATRVDPMTAPRAE